MLFVDGKKVVRSTLANIFFIFLLLLLFTVSINLQIRREILNNEAAIAVAIIRDKPQNEIEYMESFFRDKTSEEIEEGRLILEKYGYREDSGHIRAYRNISRRLYENSFILLVIIGVINIFALITNGIQTRNYIKSVDKFIDSVLTQNFNIRLKELDSTTQSKLNSRFNKMALAVKKNYDKLYDDNAFIRDSLADISHQIKTPIASLSMYNEILSNDENLSEDSQRFIEASSQQISRLRWLTESLLKISKMEANAINFKKERFIGYQMSEDFPTVFYSQLKNKKMVLVHQGDLDKEVELDYNWTKEALMNIVKNAIEHGYEDSEIIIKYTINISMIRVDVINEGDPIDSDELSKLFIRFYKSKHNTNPESVGIGLNLAKEIVERQRGTISVQNDENKVIFSLLFLK